MKAISASRVKSTHSSHLKSAMTCTDSDAGNLKSVLSSHDEHEKNNAVLTEEEMDIRDTVEAERRLSDSKDRVLPFKASR